MSKKYILVVETITKSGSLSLFSDDSGQIKELGFVVGGVDTKLSKDLTGLTSELLNRCNLKLSQLSSIAVADGPGSFTGLRVGFSFVKGLAKGLDISFRAFSILDVLLSESISAKPRCAFISVGGGKLAYKLSGRNSVEHKSLSEFRAEVLSAELDFITIRETYDLVYSEGLEIDSSQITIASDNLSSLLGISFQSLSSGSNSISYA
jgi:tRNA threonylcarbamoyl adenosine modification protein YeaZ